MKIYVYTEKGEKRAKELHLDERKAGNMAFCGYEPLHIVGSDIAKGWLARGYVEVKEVETC